MPRRQFPGWSFQWSRRVFCVQHWKSGFGYFAKKRQSHEWSRVDFEIPTSFEYLALSKWPRSCGRNGNKLKTLGKSNLFKSIDFLGCQMWRMRSWEILVNGANVWATLPPKYTQVSTSFRNSINEQSKIQSHKPYINQWSKSVFQNFGVCSKCSRLAQLYHKLHHQKQKLFSVCSEVVESRKKNSPGLDTTRMLNELLADDSWLETVSLCAFFFVSKLLIFGMYLFSNSEECKIYGQMRIHLFGKNWHWMTRHDWLWFWQETTKNYYKILNPFPFCFLSVF